MGNAINWFEIPAKNFDRACDFYSKILNGVIQKFEPSEEIPVKMGFLPHEGNGSVGGAIIEGEGYEPSDKGPIVYLNGGNDLNDVLSKVESAGGKITLKKTSIGENGFFARFFDTEGNHMAIHSMN